MGHPHRPLREKRKMRVMMGNIHRRMSNSIRSARVFSSPSPSFHPEAQAPSHGLKLLSLHHFQNACFHCLPSSHLHLPKSNPHLRSLPHRHSKLGTTRGRISIPSITARALTAEDMAGLSEGSNIQAGITRAIEAAAKMIVRSAEVRMLLVSFPSFPPFLLCPSFLLSFPAISSNGGRASSFVLRASSLRSGRW